MRFAILGILAASGALAQPDVIAMPGKSPLVSFRFVFRAGAASDPAAKPGTATLTAAMLSDGGTKDLSYKQILDKMFPMAAAVGSSADKEMTAFYGTTHVDNLEEYYGIFRAMLLEPGWRPDDLERLRDNLINALRVCLRGNNVEELG
jgi:zinc protease